MSALDQINTFLEAGDYYSAHQKALTTSTRLLAPPRRKPGQTTRDQSTTDIPWDAKAQEASELLWNSSRKLLEKSQRGSGQELGLKLVELWKSRGKTLGTEERAKVIQLIALIGPSGSWRKQFTDAVFSWSSKTGSGPAGDVEIHQYLGETLFKEQNYHQASLHLLVCPTQDAARTLADVMFAWSQLDPEGATAVGRYAARGCLSYLESTAILAARTFLAQFLHLALAAHPQLLVVRFAFPPPSSALARQTTTGTNNSDTAGLGGGDEIVVTKLASLNFLQLAVKTCQTGPGQPLVDSTPANSNSNSNSNTTANATGAGAGRRAWTELVRRYEKDIPWLRTGAEGDGKESLQALGTMYFGIKPPRAPGNAFADMLSGMFGGGGGGPGAGGAGPGRSAIGSR